MFFRSNGCTSCGGPMGIETLTIRGIMCSRCAVPVEPGIVEVQPTRRAGDYVSSVFASLRTATPRPPE